MLDQQSATNLAVQAYTKLKEVAPQHEYVRLMESPDVSDDQFKDTFWDKPEPWRNLPGSMVSMRVETLYFVAVRKILKKEHNIEI